MINIFIIHMTNCDVWEINTETYFIVYDALNSFAGEIETVAECKITAHWRLGATASEFPQLLLHWAVFPLDKAW